MDIKKDILWRVYLCFIGIILLGAIVIGRAFYIQQAEGAFWRSMGDSLHLKYVPLVPERGTIFSEDGNMLSTSIPIFDVFVDFGAEGLREKNGKRFKDNIDSLSICLANLFGDKTKAAYKKELQLAFKNEERYYTLKKKISFVEYAELRDFPLVRQGRNKSGFMIEPRDRRINPYVLLANRTIGLSRDNAKLNVGLEQSYDSLLRGTTGQRLMRYIAGAYMPVEGAIVEPENGKDIITTLDTYMQDVAENALMKMLIGNNSLHGTAIVMETATGKIKAIANLGKQANGTYAEDLNYGVGKATEPGSIFKLATLLSLFEDKYVDENTIVDCEGGAKLFYGLRIKDAHMGTGAITVKDAFLRSSNVAFAKLAEEYYHNDPSRFVEHLHHLRLDTITGIDIIASSGKPTIKKPSNRSWSKTTIPFMAHGYEELVTPMHMLMLYNAVANNGSMMKPYLVNAVTEYGIEVKRNKPEVLVERICSDETLTQLKDCLGAVVDSLHGTGHKILFDSTYSIAGKTGTAVTALDNRGYNKGNKIYQASFIGYFPAGSPKYTIAVVIQNSRESKLVYGADVSGKVFKEISDKIYAKYLSAKKFMEPLVHDTTLYNYYGMGSEVNSLLSRLNLPFLDSASGRSSWRSVSMKNNSAVLRLPEGAPNATSIIPSVIGMGLKDAVYLMENKGLKVMVNGRGQGIKSIFISWNSLYEGANSNTCFKLTLKDILYKVSIRAVKGNTDIEVKDLQIDSRQATSGTCFIAIKGSKADGHAFIDIAVANGATAVVCESFPLVLNENVTWILVENSAVAAGYASHNFYGEPSLKMKLIGVTGTNGKTTIATLLWKLFKALGYKCGLISTVQNQIDDTVHSATHTTPDAISINALLNQMVNARCEFVFMECSSHAIHQHRITGLHFTGALFSNITHDHLDYHKTFDEYIKVKKSWFDGLPSSAFAISNADDKRGAVMLQNTLAKKFYYSLKTMADFKGRILDNSLTGLHMMVNDTEVYFRMIGEFNAYNLLAVYGAAVCLGEDKNAVLQLLSSLDGAEGRFDYMISRNDKIVGIVDYAHTPDALLNVLATIKKLRQGNERIITVVGCGGDRDKTKRPVMAEVACEHSDKVIFTADNPRSEDPLEILHDMEAGVNVVARKKYVSIPDRKDAIKTAVNLAVREDIVLIAGKGHEKYQDIKGVKYDFDDKKVLSEMFDLMGR